MKKLSFSIVFFIRRTRLNKKGETPVMARITCHGVRAEFQIPRSVPPAKWNVAKERMDGNNATANEVNRYLDEVRASLLGLQREMEADGKDITAHIIKERYIGSSESLPTILELFNENNSYMAAQCGKEFSQKTIDRYSTTYRHLIEFIKRRYNRADICVSEVNYDFIDSYEKWLKTAKECNHNSTLKHIKALKKVVRAAFLKGIIKKNPFENYKLRELPVERDYLTEHELGAILNKDMKIPRLERVKDIFLFCCYTGLSYCDAQAVSVSNIVIEDGEPEIHIPRQGVMEAALSTNRIGNPLKSSTIGAFTGLDNIEKLCAEKKTFLQDPPRRKALADRIMQAVWGTGTGQSNGCIAGLEDKSIQPCDGVGSGMDGCVGGGVGRGMDVGLQGGSHGVSQYEAEHVRMDGSISQSDIERRLSEAGITAVFRRNAAGRLTGATFIDHTTRTVYNGSALAKELSANNWNELFAENRPSAADTTTAAPHLHVPSAAATSHQSTMPTATTLLPRSALAADHPTISTPTDPSADHPPMPLSTDPPKRGEQFVDEPIIIDVPSSEQYSYFEDTTLVSPRHEHDERSDDYEHYEYDTDPSRTTFRGLSHQSHTPEEIDPEFRTLHKRKKPRRKVR